MTNPECQKDSLPHPMISRNAQEKLAGESRPVRLGSVIFQLLIASLNTANMQFAWLQSVALASFIRGMLGGICVTERETWVAVGLLLTGMALLASYIPARRAARVDPMVARWYP